MSKPDITEELYRIAGMPSDEQTELWHELASERKISRKRTGILFSEVKAKRQDENTMHAAFEFASYIRERCKDMPAEDVGEGALKIACPIKEGESIIVRDAELFFSKPIVERITEGGYTPTIDEYVRAIIGDDKRGLQYHQIEQSKIDALLKNLENLEWIDAVGLSTIKDINRHALAGANPPLDAALELNERYAKVSQEEQILVFDKRTKRAYKPAEFHKALSSATVWLDGKAVKKSIIWFNHPVALLYNEVNLYPKGKDHNGHEVDCDEARIFNVWLDYAITPKPGDWSLFKQFIFEVICDGNQEHFTYVLDWIAHMLQRPWEKPGVALVLKGLKRIGKGVFARALCDMLGMRLAAVYSKSEHVVGRFSGYPRLLEVLEEALYARDPKIEGPLKSMIADELQAVEVKFQMPTQVYSYARYIFNANADAPVPDTYDDMRYLIMDVSPSHKDDHPYFAVLKKQMYLEEGLAAMMHDLMQCPLDEFNVRAVPYSKAKAQVVRDMLDRKMQAVLDIIERGEIPAATSVDGEPHAAMRLNEHNVTYVNKDHVYRALEPDFRDYKGSRGMQTAIGMFLMKEGFLVQVQNDAYSSTSKYVWRPLAEIRAMLRDKFGITILPSGDQTGFDVQQVAAGLKLIDEVMAKHGLHAADAVCKAREHLNEVRNVARQIAALPHARASAIPDHHDTVH